MAQIFDDISRTLDEYLLIPNLTTKRCVPASVDLSSSLTRYRSVKDGALRLNIPIVSAIMQSVSNQTLAIELARCGGMSFIYSSQSIAAEAEMVRKVKTYKAGFVTSDSNLKPGDTLADLLKVKQRTGHSTMAVTANGEADGKLLGIVTSKDYRVTRDELDKKVADFMTPFSRVVHGKEGISLKEANDLLWKSKLDCIPVVDEKQNLVYLVFRKDYTEHHENESELLDAEKRLMVGAGINTHDYAERVPALVEAGADALCIDSSHGYTEYQNDTIRFIKGQYGDAVKVGAGNIVDGEGFRYLVDAGADFIKVGIGGGSICITREQRAIGRGQATAVIDVARARDAYFAETGVYIPICSDGGISHDHQIALALALGADFVMLGRYFARFDESPSKKVLEGNRYLKEYWGEGTNRAQNWQRYDLGGGENALIFEEGVDGYVPYAGKLKDNLDITLAKIRATLSACGSATLKEFQQQARLTVVSPRTIVEGGVHDVITKEGLPER